MSITRAIDVLKTGGVVAYPTEGVYGLGCDPLNQSAVMKILQLKQRPVSQGLILIAASWEQLQAWVLPVPVDALKKVLATWPGPTTWIFPKSSYCPTWISGDFNTVAVRVTHHPIAASICREFGGPIVSTSANLHNQSPALTKAQVQQYFNHHLDYIVSGEVGDLTKPTPILNALTGALIRG